MENFSANIAAAWIAVAVGSIWGAFMGLFFHRSGWLGGYASFERRLLRLGHIACFALALVNIAFVYTVNAGFANGPYLSVAGGLLIASLVTMPLVCAITAWRSACRHVFVIPVGTAVGAIALLLVSLTCLSGCAYVPRPRGAPDVDLAPLANELRTSVEELAGRIGERNLYQPHALDDAARWIEAEFRAYGYADVRRLPVPFLGAEFLLEMDSTAWNIEAVLPGTGPGTIVIGAHYDTKVGMRDWHGHWPPQSELGGTPGANDNASGVAALLALARAFAGRPQTATLRLVAFVNEEPPFYQTAAMGSRVYAREIGSRTSSPVRMISLETLGVYSKRETKKRISLASLFGLPERPRYVAFLSNFRSRKWSKTAAETFARNSSIAARAVAFPAVFRRVSWSDDWSFWQEGYPAFAVTDTAYLRHDDYHEASDTPEKLDYLPMAEVVHALRSVLAAETPTEWK